MTISRRLRFEILRRDGHTCRYCGAKAPDVALTVDHVIPVALGGTDDPTNLVTACAACNSGKTSITPDAPVVAQVHQDALRWARAMRTVSSWRKADLAVEREILDEFLAAWNRWRIFDEPVPLDENWRPAVLGWLEAGLEMEDLTHFIEVAMRSQAYPDNKFRYFAGCAWNELTLRQQMAHRHLERQERADPQEAPGGP